MKLSALIKLNVGDIIRYNSKSAIITSIWYKREPIELMDSENKLKVFYNSQFTMGMNVEGNLIALVSQYPHPDKLELGEFSL